MRVEHYILSLCCDLADFTIFFLSLKIWMFCFSLSQIKNFSSPIVIPPHETDSSLSLAFTPSDTLTSLSTMLRLGTNASLFTIPVHAYTGKLKVSITTNLYTQRGFFIHSPPFLFCPRATDIHRR